jgi:hypothetical protein
MKFKVKAKTEEEFFADVCLVAETQPLVTCSLTVDIDDKAALDVFVIGQVYDLRKVLDIKRNDSRV